MLPSGKRRRTGAERSAGRPRDRATHAAILKATRALLLESGYHRLTVEAVASAAGTTRSTIYRWWPNRGALALEATAEHLEIGRVPDTGSTREDLLAAVTQLIETFSDRLAGIVILAVIGNLDDDATMATTFRDRWVYPWRATAADAIARGTQRGDLPEETDVQFVLNVIVGTVFQSTITVATPATDGLADAIVDLLLGTPDRA